jgi:beta-mannosidase
VTNNLSQPFYVTPRAHGRHLSLNADWKLGWLKTPITDLNQLDSIAKWIPASVPNSVQWALSESKELPHPYHGLNSRQYAWVPDHVWYYSRSFPAPELRETDYLFLCFDGAGYHSRIWLNGELLGSHEGLFGGPIVEISKLLRRDQSNSLVVEVCAPSWGIEPWNEEALQKVMVGWGIGGGNGFVSAKSGIGTKEFLPFGLWRDVRMEVVPNVHMERPFLVTRTVSSSRATLSLSLEVLVNTHSLLHELHHKGKGQIRAIFDPLSSRPAQPLQIRFSLFDPAGSTPAATFTFIPELYQGRNFISHTFDVSNPKLWWPNGLGEPSLYDARIELLDGDAVLDTIEFPFGIRTIDRLPTPNPQSLDNWTDWHFVVNGRPIFVKGMNWAWPMDILLHLPESGYRWQLEAARDAGIQMLRVPGCAGHPETDDFFSLCNQLGLMVAEDFPMANVAASDWPLLEWESQVMHLIYRLRNHPSLVAWFGGNECNPYIPENSAVCGIMERCVADFDGSRLFLRSSPDKGSTHQYPDMDPSWAGHIFKHVPFFAEYGIFDLCEPESIREVVDPRELSGPLEGIFSEEFAAQRPEFVHQFLQYWYGGPQKSLWDRMSLIEDLQSLDLDSLVDVARAATGEFFSVTFDLLQANYPRTTGVLGWSWTIPRPIVFPCCLDTFGQATALFYFLKRTFEKTHVAIRLPHLVWGVGETVPIHAAVIHSGENPLSDTQISVTILDDKFHELWRKDASLDIKHGTSVTDLAIGHFPIDESLRDAFFFILSALRNTNGTLISRSVYWPRCLRCMDDIAFRSDYRSSPKPTLLPEDGPLLRPRVMAQQTTLTLTEARWHSHSEDESRLAVELRNTGSKPAFMTQVEVLNCRRSFYGDDNFFWLAPGESRTLHYRVRWREPHAINKAQVAVRAWNADRVIATA